MNLDNKIQWTHKIFDSLDPLKKYQLCFSGGKDSHCLTGVYLQWLASAKKKLDIQVIFADTLLEPPLLYETLARVEEGCRDRGLIFRRVSRPLEQDFWVLLFGRGYPVPSFAIRWCTKVLKIDPIKKEDKGRISLTGSHVAESQNRDVRLAKCGSLDCGIDLITGNIEPISIWTNCDVWDWLALYGDEFLGEGAFNNLDVLYRISSESQINTKQGSLRMGCFCCPVVGMKSLEKDVAGGVVDAIALEVRLIIEGLRSAPRLPVPRTGNDGRPALGAIRVDERIKAWGKLQPLLEGMKKMGWISDEIIRQVESLLKERAYPPSYPQSWIEKGEPLARIAPWLAQKDDEVNNAERSLLKAVRDRQQGKCLECEQGSSRLKYHFIDYRLDHASPDNLVLLCSLCYKRIAKVKKGDLQDIWEHDMKQKLKALTPFAML